MIPICPNCFKKNSSIKYLPSVNKFNLYYCHNCETGFVYPIPKDLGKYYNSNYWISPGIIGQLKDLLFKFFQKRRADWVSEHTKKGDVLDVGSGEGNFGKNVPAALSVLSIDSKTAQIKNPDVKRVDFLKWKNNKKFNAVVFWESLEHTINPQAYLNKVSRVLKEKGLVFIEYPRFDSLESQIFGRHWFHLDIPRHSSHLTYKGLSILLKRANFVIIENKSVPALEYSVWGFVASVLDIFNIKPTDKLKGAKNVAIILSLIPIGILAFVMEIIFLIFNQSPIGLIIAKKKRS
jgi:SAM-dependent methyltransferase